MASRQIRPIRIDGNIAYVPLSKGYEAVIDAADVPLVDGLAWHVTVHKSGNAYAGHGQWMDGKVKRVAMHRLIMGHPAGLEVDHIDGNGLNNRRGNLRAATSGQNKHNSRTPSHNTSGFKGVNWHAGTQKWQARIRVAKVSKSLGYYNTPEAAHAAYCKASAELHGEFGRTK